MSLTDMERAVMDLDYAMSLTRDSLRRAFRQQLAGDALMGVKDAPIARSSVDSLLHALTDQPDETVDTETVAQKTERLRILDETRVRGCTRCGLSNARTQTVFGQGNPSARVVFVGEAPGFEEDRQGLAFVGRAGQLLTRMIIAMGLSRDDVFICNVLKCRPPNNRDPAADEILACSPYLREQLAIIEPEVLIALGAPAAKTLLNTTLAIGKLRGRFHDYHPSDILGHEDPIPLMPTYHPAYLLRNPAEKAKTWSDLQIVMQLLGLQAPA